MKLRFGLVINTNISKENYIHHSFFLYSCLLTKNIRFVLLFLQFGAILGCTQRLFLPLASEVTLNDVQTVGICGAKDGDHCGGDHHCRMEGKCLSLPAPAL